MTDCDVIIIGAGAAGLMCASAAAKRGRRVLLLEGNDRIGEKIRISGGGRCNFTNRQVLPKNFLSHNPHFCISALRRYRPEDFIALVEKHGITYHERKRGKLFCDGKSDEIIDMLARECDGAEIKTSAHIHSVEKTGEGYIIDDRHACASLVVACGGKSIPKMGASGFGYDIARQFGHGVIEPEPALVPLTFQNDLRTRLKSLSGISLEATVSGGGISFTDAILFTHRGLSGPAILQISSYLKPGEEISINLAPDRDMPAFLKEARMAQPKIEIHNMLARIFARALAQFICAEAGVEGRLADLSNDKLGLVADFIHGWRIKPNGSEGFRTAEVTRGGVDTKEISSKTFESALSPGLYFIGEVLDVTGQLGGYNFQWAWASGHAAGQFV